MEEPRPAFELTDDPARTIKTALLVMVVLTVWSMPMLSVSKGTADAAVLFTPMAGILLVGLAAMARRSWRARGLGLASGAVLAAVVVELLVVTGAAG